MARIIPVPGEQAAIIGEKKGVDRRKKSREIPGFYTG
jgi:hypothetical protein